MAAEVVDPVALAQSLIRCPSVTPEDAGAMAVLVAALEPLGFTCQRLRSRSYGCPPIENLYARLGDKGPNLCFAGHTDVVSVGDWSAWSLEPFSGEVENGRLYGRGAADMKGAIGAMVAAISRHLASGKPIPGSISLLITGDEEGRAVNGTRTVLEWMQARGETMDACVLGEPTNPERMGTTIKVGRRGSLTGRLTVNGVQGHVAYPHLADNPLPRLVKMLDALESLQLDNGSEHFDPSNLEVVSIDAGNRSTNVIPAKGEAVFNIRFNDCYTSESLSQLLRETLDAVNPVYQLEIEVSGESFLCKSEALADLMVGAVESVTGIQPERSTSGGTSDARFIHRHCPVVEFGLVGATMHKVDESVAVTDIETLTKVYGAIIDRYFAAP